MAQQQLEQSSRKSLIIKRIGLVFLALTLVFLCFTLYRLMGQDNKVGRFGEEINKANNYYTYNNHVYNLIPGNGYFILPEADPHTFTGINETNVYSSSPLAKDRNHVYCSTHIIPTLKPDENLFRSGGYISNGLDAYYCSTVKQNPDYHWWQELVNSQAENDPDKAQYYYHELVQVKTNQPKNIKALARFSDYASDGQALFYQGQLVTQADAATVSVLNYTDFSERRNDIALNYAKDKQHVFYQGQALSGAHPEAFIAFEPANGQWDDEYGQDTSTSQFYAKQKPFPAEVDGVNAQSLKLLIADRNHANHELFYNQQGLFYWDYKTEKLSLSCKNPFQGQQPSEIMPGVFADDKNTYLVQGEEEWGGRGPRSGISVGLIAKYTYLRQIANVSRADWQKKQDVFNSKNNLLGTLWFAKGHWYFQTHRGNGLFFYQPLYGIDDPDKFVNALSQIDSTYDFQQWLNKDIGEQLCTSKSRYRFWFFEL